MMGQVMARVLRIGLGIGLIVGGIVSWFFPKFQGVFFGPADVTTGEGRIIGAIFVVGGLLLCFLSPGESKE